MAERRPAKPGQGGPPRAVLPSRANIVPPRLVKSRLGTGANDNPVPLARRLRQLLLPVLLAVAAAVGVSQLI